MPESAGNGQFENSLKTLEEQAQAKLAQLDELVAAATISNAKICEISATIEALQKSIEAAASLSNAALTEAQAKALDAGSAATQAIAAKTQIVDDQAVIATKSEHIQEAQNHADKVRGELDKVLTSATQHATEAEGLKSRAQSAADSSASLLLEVKASKASAEADRNTTKQLSNESLEAATVSKDLAAKAAVVAERISAYEDRLTQLEAQCDLQLKRIVELLPGAASTGLAVAFDQRRQTFLKPSLRWQWLFVGSVICLVILAGSGLWNVYSAHAPFTYDELLRLWLARLPIAGALVWLALYSGRESALAKRLEEDYGYKSAIASSFMGFHKQMSEIGEKAALNTPLAQLCADTLTTIASPPGRIYEKHQLTISPGSELREIAKTVVDATPTNSKS
ncbi:MAG: hypothetical protein Q8M91_09270 [Polaromonas sp.]|nr:hypothetical protein [Polaromonas sp.]